MKADKITSPIDFVITWVDGNDPNWKKELERFSLESVHGDARDIRFRDWGTLPYWFRGVELFAPWVDKIHFVTWGHIPKWLNIDHPKLHIVRHEDFIPQKFLPTFNSHTIELNFHRIPNLAEQFVYFNDDVFLTAPVRPADFFKNGYPRDTFAQNTILFGPDNVGAINGNNLCIINKYFSKQKAYHKNWKKWFSPVNGFENLIRTVLLLPWPWFPGFLYRHTMTNLLKSTYETVWEKEELLLERTCSCHFRQPSNVNQWLFKFWQLADGNFIPISERFSYCYHVQDSVEPICHDILSRKYRVLCINDTGKTTNYETLSAQVCAAFEETFPSKSEFEC